MVTCTKVNGTMTCKTAKVESSRKRLGKLTTTGGDTYQGEWKDNFKWGKGIVSYTL